MVIVHVHVLLLPLLLALQKVDGLRHIDGVIIVVVLQL
jgi:hypothetical protein